MQWLDRKYIQLLSSRLEGFKWKSPNLALCRCPLCGDSQTNKKKKRGYFYTKEDKIVFFCHNGCGGISVKNLLKTLDRSLYNSYSMELISSRKKDETHITKTNNVVKFSQNQFLPYLKELKKVSQLPNNHPAKIYVQTRKIPNEYHSILRWAPEFMKWTNAILPDKFEEKDLQYDEGRVVIPFFDRKNDFFAYTGRAISEVKNGLRYVLIVLNHDIPLIYGLNSFDYKSKSYAFEGPIDSIFIPNSVAFAGNYLALTYLKDYHIIPVYDNEPRSKETKEKILAAVNLGYEVVIWPNWVEYKDINKMVMEGWTPEYIRGILDANIFKGLDAKIRLEQWSKR